MTPEPSTVLVVDDDPSVREALSDLFQSVGLRVEAFAVDPGIRQERAVGGYVLFGA